MLIIGIAGGSGSGKTTVARKITEKIHDHVVVVSQDSYYKDQSHLPLEERQALNFDHPNAIDWDLLVQNVRALKEGKDVEQPVYPTSPAPAPRPKRSTSPPHRSSSWRAS